MRSGLQVGRRGRIGLGCGGPGGIAPWPARGPAKPGLAASSIIKDFT